MAELDVLPTAALEAEMARLEEELQRRRADEFRRQLKEISDYVAGQLMQEIEAHRQKANELASELKDLAQNLSDGITQTKSDISGDLELISPADS